MNKELEHLGILIENLKEENSRLNKIIGEYKIIFDNQSPEEVGTLTLRVPFNLDE